jgi:hypothetical protein
MMTYMDPERKVLMLRFQKNCLHTLINRDRRKRLSQMASWLALKPNIACNRPTQAAIAALSAKCHFRRDT